MAKTKGFSASSHPRKDTKEELALGLATPKLYFSAKSFLKGNATPSRHSRSRSAPDNDFDLENWDLSPSNFQQAQVSSQSVACKKQHILYDRRAALEQDVAELQKRLKNERAVRHALEKAMGRASSAISPGHRHLTPQTKELIHEINFLEEEVVDLEQHVLSLYRRFFSRCFSRSSSLFNVRQKNEPHSMHEESQQKQQRQAQPDQSKGTKINSSKQKQSHTHRRNISAAMQGSSATAKSASQVQPKSRHNSILCETLSMAGSSQPSHSQNILQAKAAKEMQTRSNSSSLNEDGPRPLRDYLSETPNRLSEELIRCMATIYCKLSDPPLSVLGVPESPSSCTSSSTSLSSIHGMFSDGWSPGCKADYSYEMPLIDPFQVKGKAGGVGAYNSMVEVPWICVDKDRLSYVARMLRDFRSMVEQLEKVDPSQLKHDEKLAFWINIYNALLMHAYLAYGIPRNNLKRMTLLQRAAYKVGGRSINAHTIEHCILGCRSHRPTQWLQNLLLPGSKFKAGDERRSYAIETSEPLVCFALCCGGRSDPAVRVYTSKNVHEELESAKKEFLQASIGFQSDKKVLLPKILEWYAREASIATTTLLDWVSQFLDEKEKEMMLKCVRSKPHKNTSHCIEWVSYNFNFRYLFDRDLASRFSSRMH
ncbi:hypothetical protein L7F22_066304 [Adiantum nelumboides]|nr:hypothetical protein [Adiantum nelumboides]